MSLDRTGGIDLPFIARLYGKPEEADRRRAGRPDLPRPRIAKHWQTADDYLSGNVRAKLAAAEAAGPAYARNAEALRRCSPKTCCPATSTPTSAPRGYR